MKRVAAGVPVPAAVLGARARADCLVPAEEVRRAIDRVAVRLALRLAESNPLVLAVLHGGLPYAAALLERWEFPLQLGYLHVGRYRDAVRGAELHWHAVPEYSLEGRTLLLVDDVFDRGITLAALRDWAQRAGALDVVTTVLVDKRVPEPRPMVPDAVALQCPDRYLFGCGMDYRGYWRNLPAIYALAHSDETAELNGGHE